MKHEMKCRDCHLCDVKMKQCTRTGREVKLDSIRNCKFGVDRKLVEEKK